MNKVTFSSNTSIMKLMYRAYTKKRVTPIRNWGAVIYQLFTKFQQKVPL